MNSICIGAPPHMAVRPLIYGLTQAPRDGVELVYGEPGPLAEDLERGRLDAALIPSIEFLRGSGGYAVEGPALVITGRTDSFVLVTAEPLSSVHRVAVDEHSRTPLAALRILLDRAHGVKPDFCVHKGNPLDWSEAYDGVVLSGDRGLRFVREQQETGVHVYDIGEMWRQHFDLPLVLSMWAYNDPDIEAPLTQMLIRSRDIGVASLDALARGLSQTSGFDADTLDDYFAGGWSYGMGPDEEAGLRTLEQEALAYQLIHTPRLDEVPAR